MDDPNDSAMRRLTAEAMEETSMLKRDAERERRRDDDGGV